MVITRSSYESNYIDFFEKHQIQWDYEPFRISLESGTYLPDFLIRYQGLVYLIEVKGYLLEKDRSKYLSNKINRAYDYAKQHGMEFIFTYESKPKTMEQLISMRMKEYF